MYVGVEGGAGTRTARTDESGRESDVAPRTQTSVAAAAAVVDSSEEREERRRFTKHSTGSNRTGSKGRRQTLVFVVCMRHKAELVIRFYRVFR